MEVKSIPEAQLNYPSFSVVLGSSPLTFTRTLTNVGQVSSTYTLKIVSIQGVGVDVSHNKLVFKEGVEPEGDIHCYFCQRKQQCVYRG